jgi:hypothetical protein
MQSYFAALGTQVKNTHIKSEDPHQMIKGPVGISGSSVRA